MARPPLELFAEVQTASGARFRWGDNLPSDQRLTGFSFGTRIGDGFTDATGNLARRIDQDYPDLNLVDSVSFVGADGSIAYEGRVSALPREVSDRHSIGVTLTGWMAHAKDRQFREIYVDRSIGSWSDMSTGRKAVLLTAGTFSLGDYGTGPDQTDGSAGLTLGVPDGWVSPFKPIAEAYYDAGPGVTVGKIEASWRKSPAINAAGDPQWTWKAIASSNDKQTAVEVGPEQRATGPAGFSWTPTADYRYMALQLSYNATPISVPKDTRYAIDWFKLAVYGNHGLQTYGGQPGQPSGVYVSDVIRNIAQRWCPELNTDGVLTNSLVLHHCAFRDRTFPYDAFTLLNGYTLWHLGVWDNRTLHYRPYDFTDYQWQVRTDDPGVAFAPQGDSIDDLHNGIVVSYEDISTGIDSEITPETDIGLRDDDPSNPWNAHGVQRWDEVSLSSPDTAAGAAQRGYAILRDRNRRRAPGTITVQGTIRDRQGHVQPVWKVRAGDTISVTNFPNDTPRLINETRYDHDSHTITISVDQPLAVMEAVDDRVQMALSALGLT